MNEQERRIKELEAQTAQMGEVIGQMAHDHAEQGREIARLQRENAEVRELVRDLYRCDDESCTHCKYWNQGDEFYCNLGVGWKARRMRELGIEME